MKPRHLTQAKIRRALDALIEVMQTEEAKDSFDNGLLDQACDYLRELQAKAVR